MTCVCKFGCGIVVLVAIALCGAVGAEDAEDLAVATNRTGKYQRFGSRLSNRITKTGLNADSCESQTGYSGTCMTRFNCMRNGGTVSGFCGTYGVCCETNMLCGGTSKLKRTLIQSPGTIPSRCAYVFEPYSSKVCQIRIEMEEFRLQQPQVVATAASDTVECVDRFEVNEMMFCGFNDNQHMYVQFDVSGGTDANVNLNFILPNRDPVTRWRLVVTQLECPTAAARKGLLPFAKNAGLHDLKSIFSSQGNDLSSLAPHGCLQYFTERTGTFESFNYNGGTGPYMPNQNYAICFQRQVGDSAIEFNFVEFALPGEGVNSGYDTDCHAMVPTTGKADDYLMIPGAVLIDSKIQPTYFCGTTSKGTRLIYGSPGPFVVYFNSDDATSAEEVGFQISYGIA